MKPGSPLKLFVGAFVAAVLLYAASYSGIEHLRVRKGPWEVSFTNGPAGEAAVTINHPVLAITNVQLRFPQHHVGPGGQGAPMKFAQPRQVPYEVPFGRCVFMDTTFLPGTLTFQWFGHEIELLPRVLVVDRREHPWVSWESITLNDLPSGRTSAGAKPARSQ
jgi:hypothetical protein